MVIHQSMWIQWLSFKNLTKKVNDPKMTFDPTSVDITCVNLPKDHHIQVPWKYIKVCGYSDPFFNNLNQRSLTPRWPLTPHEVTCMTLPKDHCVQFPWGCINVCGYSYQFCKTLTKITAYYMYILRTERAITIDQNWAYWGPNFFNTRGPNGPANFGRISTPTCCDVKRNDNCLKLL